MASNDSVFKKLNQMQKQPPVSAPKPVPKSTPTKKSQPEPAIAPKKTPSKTPAQTPESQKKAAPSKKPTTPSSKKPAPPSIPAEEPGESPKISPVTKSSKKPPTATKKPAAKVEPSHAAKQAPKPPLKSDAVKSQKKKPVPAPEETPEKPQKPAKSPKAPATPVPEDKAPEQRNPLPKYGAVCVHNYNGEYSILAWMQPGDPLVLKNIAAPDGKLTFIGDMQKMGSSGQPNSRDLGQPILQSAVSFKETGAESAPAQPKCKTKSSPASDNVPKKPTPPKINLYIIDRLYQQELEQLDTEGMTQKELDTIKKRCRAIYNADAENYKKQYSQEFAEYRSGVLGLTVGEKRKPARSKEPPKKKQKSAHYSSFDQVAKDVWAIFFPAYSRKLAKHPDFAQEAIDPQETINNIFTPEIVNYILGQISEWLESCCTLDVTKSELREFVEENYGIFEKMIQDMNQPESEEASEDAQDEVLSQTAPSNRKVAAQKDTNLSENMDSSSDADEASQIQKPRDDADAEMGEYDIQGQTVDEIDLEEADQEPLPTSGSQEHSGDIGEELGSGDESEDDEEDSRDNVSGLIDDQGEDPVDMFGDYSHEEEDDEEEAAEPAEPEDD